MRFFLDHNVPVAVAETLIECGHEVLIQKTMLPPNASDPVVALTSSLNDAILISFDKDHKAIANRHGIANKQLKRLSRIHFRCDYPEAAKRIKEALSFIQHEWDLAQQSTDPRMFVEILGYGLKTLR